MESSSSAGGGRRLSGVSIDQAAQVTRCSSCRGEIWWGTTQAGRRNPFDVTRSDEGIAERTDITLFSTCPQARSWSKR
jgi:hypothetical protein